MEQLTEGSYVYTDLGIERVHWCIVNGEKELVTPKGYILGDVPDFDTYARLVKNNIALELGKIKQKEENAQLKEELQNQAFILKSRESEIVKLKELLKRIGKELSDCPTCVEGSWKAELVDKIDQVLQEKNNER